MGVEMSDIEQLFLSFQDICSSYDNLLYPGGFRDSGIAVVSSVFSIQAKDDAVRSVVNRFAQRQGVEVAALGAPDREPDAYSVARLAEDLAHLSEGSVVAGMSRSQRARSTTPSGSTSRGAQRTTEAQGRGVVRDSPNCATGGLANITMWLAMRSFSTSSSWRAPISSGTQPHAVSSDRSAARSVTHPSACDRQRCAISPCPR
jgi:hypothetical protein